MTFITGSILAIMFLGLVAFYFSPYDLRIEEEED